MSKIEQFRQRVADAYFAFELEEAAKHGEALLREHWHNQSMLTQGYANDIFNLARVYDELGSFERAAELYTDGAQLYARPEMGDAEGYLNCLNNLAAVLHDMGHEESSAHLFGQLVSVRRLIGNEMDIDFADRLYNFANALTDAKHIHHAKKWHGEALKIRRAAGNTEDVIDSLHSLAFLHEDKEEYEKAVPLAETAMELAQGDDYTCAVYYLAGLYNAWGQYESALPRYEEAMNLTRARVGRYHAAYVKVAADRANLLNKVGRVYEALTLQTEIRALLEATDSISQNAYTDCLRQTADLQKQLGEYEKAEALLLRSLRITRYYKRKLAEDIVHLIRFYLYFNNHERAMEVLVYALMNSDSKGPELARWLMHLAFAFNTGYLSEQELENPTEPVPEAIIEALRTMNNPSTLAPVIKKWTDWENELFIPAFVMPPQAGPDTK